MIVATALVLMMTLPGLALFYSGMTRKKNILATMAQSVIATALVSLLWGLVGYSLAFSGDGAYFGDFRAHRPDGHRRRDDQPAGQDHPRDFVHGLSDDLRGHHLRAGRRRGGRAHEVLGLHAVLRGVAVRRLYPFRALGVGRRLPAKMGLPGFRRRHGGAHQRRRRRAGRGAGHGQAPGLWPRESRAVRSVAGRRRHRAVVGRLVRLQRRLGARRRFARGVRHRRDASRPPAPARWPGAGWSGSSAASRRCWG